MQKNIGKKRSDSVGKGALYLTLSVLIVKIIGFVYKLPISYLIGDEGMGYFNTAYTVFSFFYLICTGGVPKAVSLLVAKEKAQGREEQAEKILFCALRIFSVVGVTLSVGLFIFAVPIASLVGSSKAAFSLICIAPSLFFVAAGGVLRGYLNGEMRLFAIAVSSLVEGVFKFVLGLSFAMLGVRLGLGVSIVSGLTILGISISGFISALMLFYSCKQSLKARCKINIAGERGEIIKGLFKVALPITLSTGLSGISGMIDLSLIMHRLVSLGISEVEATALYGNYTTLALPLISFATSLLVPISTACAPVIASAYSKRDYVTVRTNATKFLSVTLLFALPLSLGFLLFGEEILILLFEDSSAEIATPLLAVLSPSVVFLALLTLINTFLEAIGRTKSALLSMSVGCVVKIFLSYILIGKESFSILGAPISTTVSYAISLLISATVFYKSAGGGVEILGSFFKIGLSSVISVTFARALYLAMSPYGISLPLLIICVLLCAVCYFSLSFLLGTVHIKTNEIMSNITKNGSKYWKKGRN